MIIYLQVVLLLFQDFRAYQKMGYNINWQWFRCYSGGNAKIFDTDSCEIYTDVDGVYSSDPNKIPWQKN